MRPDFLTHETAMTRYPGQQSVSGFGDLKAVLFHMKDRFRAVIILF